MTAPQKNPEAALKDARKSLAFARREMLILKSVNRQLHQDLDHMKATVLLMAQAMERADFMGKQPEHVQLIIQATIALARASGAIDPNEIPF